MANAATEKVLNKALFLDRDGTLIKTVPYLHKIEDVELLEHVIPFLLTHQAQGYVLIMVTNQSGVARGFYTEEVMHGVNAFVIKLLVEHGVVIKACYHCPHLPEDAAVLEYQQECACRKPLPGMLLQAAQDHDIDLATSIMLGDSQCDFDAGIAAGCQVIDVVSLLNK